MPSRFHVPLPLHTDQVLDLPEGAARHVQVLRLQPGAPLCLFNGDGGEWAAAVLAMGRKSVSVRVGAHQPGDREARRAVTLAVGMPANERMDFLVEKATELGVAAIQPLVCERSVLRLSGERAERKQAHWQAVAVAACEQSGRTRVPRVAPVAALLNWLDSADAVAAPERCVLSLRPGSQPLATTVGVAAAQATPLCFLSGPEGGLSEAEERAAAARGFQPVTLGPRTLRADTAPLAALSWIGLST